MSALGAFSQSIIVSTVYTNLGDEAVMHALNETEVNIVVTSHELLPKFRTILHNCPNITHVIYMEDQIFQTDKSGFKVQNIVLYLFMARANIFGGLGASFMIALVRGYKMQLRRQNTVG